MARLHPREFGARFAAMPRAVRIVVPVLFGVFAAIGHAPWVFGFVPVVVAFVLASLLMPVAPRGAGWFGWLFGLGYFAFNLRWIVEPFLVDIARHGWMAPFAILLMAGGLALFWAVAFWVARWMSQGGAHAMLWLPVTMTLAELLRAHLFSGFPWGMPSYVVIGDMADVLFAWVGPHGANLFLFAWAGLFAFGVARGSGRAWVAMVALVAGLFGLVAITPDAPAPMTYQTVRVIQPNAPQHQKWDPAWMPVFFDRAIAQTGAGDAPDVVVWPETSVPTLLNYAEPWFEQMTLAARGAPVVAGIQRREGEDYYNSLVVVDGPQDISAIYDKAHLVPFGEYIPLAWLLEPIGLGVMVDQVAGFARGTRPGLVEIDGLGLVRVLICYEGIFPEEIQIGEARADVLLIITNDAWFGNGPGPRQHLVQAQARAIEQGLPVIRSANTGISAVIDARGRITAQLPLNEAGYLDAVVPAALPPTLYARIGDWPLTVLLGVFILGGAVLRRRFAVDDAGVQG